MWQLLFESPRVHDLQWRKGNRKMVAKNVLFSPMIEAETFRKIRVRWLLSHWGVTRFGDVSSLWQYKSSTNFWRFLSHLPKCWAYFGIFWHSWTNFHCCKWPNIKNNPTFWSHWLRSSIDIMFFINISLKLSLFFFLKWAIPGLFLFIFIFSIQLMINK